jgi:hypothetical protein
MIDDSQWFINSELRSAIARTLEEIRTPDGFDTSKLQADHGEISVKPKKNGVF